MKKPSVVTQTLGLAAELIVLELVFIYAGRYLDEKYQWPQYGVTIGGLLALIVWLTHAVIMVKKIEKEEQEESKSQK